MLFRSVLALKRTRLLVEAAVIRRALAANKSRRSPARFAGVPRPVHAGPGAVAVDVVVVAGAGHDHRGLLRMVHLLLVLVVLALPGLMAGRCLRVLIGGISRKITENQVRHARQ